MFLVLINDGVPWGYKILVLRPRFEQWESEDAVLRRERFGGGDLRFPNDGLVEIVLKSPVIGLDVDEAPPRAKASVAIFPRAM